MGVKQISKSLKATGNALDSTFYQLKVLSQKDLQDDVYENFSHKLKSLDVKEIKPTHLEIFQINIGKLCNQTCSHCHVDAGPDRKEENMSFETLERCLYLIKTYGFKTVDITGGAPEMNAHFRWFVEECTQAGVKVIVRCNLTIIKANKKYADLPEFFAANKVYVVSSLPHFSAARTDAQRGDGVFEDSISALQMLNAVGYGKEGSGLVIDLVFNPSGAFLPGDQASLESEFKRQLKRKFDIVFNSLYAITNLPISRFLDYLLETGKYLEYMHKLVEAFNPATLEGLMCKNTISISWDGYLYDCDFNQMLDLKFTGKAKHINDFDVEEIMNRKIIINNHCYGCTAGAGSSCGGEIA
ncbi:arsenosugar biosynthesis radical SAM (seleno)protein ArsS [Pedobacter cryophilus]|uniref:Radical SAM/Cys-rich domain protein n=1 Tax=Pedobacter cryophilus TaxID=2571271 RepID=A0A4U1BYF3_9SPHI|nr:arsenosugar biosynthesis radical SAM (seleno)protein ArsS [Pedobacter cryophilus]TKB96693.1 radical SAM/Cys-rich domain protein [Pedobacter cryophilus]